MVFKVDLESGIDGFDICKKATEVGEVEGKKIGPARRPHNPCIKIIMKGRLKPLSALLVASEVAEHDKGDSDVSYFLRAPKELMEKLKGREEFLKEMGIEDVGVVGEDNKLLLGARVGHAGDVREFVFTFVLKNAEIVEREGKVEEIIGEFEAIQIAEFEKIGGERVKKEEAVFPFEKLEEEGVERLINVLSKISEWKGTKEEMVKKIRERWETMKRRKLEREMGLKKAKP